MDDNIYAYRNNLIILYTVHCLYERACAAAEVGARLAVVARGAHVHCSVRAAVVPVTACACVSLALPITSLARSLPFQFSKSLPPPPAVQRTQRRSEPPPVVVARDYNIMRVPPPNDSRKKDDCAVCAPVYKIIILYIIIIVKYLPCTALYGHNARNLYSETLCSVTSLL